MKNKLFKIRLLLFISTCLLHGNASAQEPHPLFRWPLQVTAGFQGFEAYRINNYVDQDATSGVKDWNGGTRTYDDHTGIDIDLAPYFWNMMDAEVVDVVAAAPGRIIARQDGNTDRNCTKNSLDWNGVQIQHTDGSQSWYLHMKSGSLTARQVGDWVEEGEYLGKVGSSGSSTNPHLHFEVHDKEGKVIEPFQGSYNNKNTDSWWQNQKPYLEPAVLDMFTSLKAPEDVTCATVSNLFKANHFNPSGGNIYFNIYLRDMTKNQKFTLKVIRPDGTLRWAQEYTADNNFGFNYRRFTFTRTNEMTGTWRYEVTYNGKTYNRHFSINCTDHYDVTTNMVGNYGFMASNYINASSIIAINSNVLMEAGNVVRLLPGFHVYESSNFVARIDACTINGQLTSDEDVESRSLNLEMEEVIAEPSLTASPNPFSDEITIRASLSKTAPASLVLFDISGRAIQNIDSQSLIDSGNLETNLSLPNLAPGMYFLRMHYADGMKTVKLVKQNRN